MIFTERVISVRKGVSSIDEPVILYRGDYEVEIRFTIINSRFKFIGKTNVIDSENAAYGQLAVLKPNGDSVFSEINECNNGGVNFILTKEMIDEINELGLYSFQIRLFDQSKESRASIPPVEYGIEIREPIVSEDHTNSVNESLVGYSIAKTTTIEDIPSDPFDVNGKYIKTEWETGDRITEGKLNKIEKALYAIDENCSNDTETLSSQMTSNYNVLNSRIQNVQTNQDAIVPLIENLNTTVNMYTTTINKLKDKMDTIIVSIDEYASLSNNGVDWSPALERAISDLGDSGGVILFGNSTYKFKNEVSISPSLGDNDYSTCRKFKITSNNKATFEFYGTNNTFIVCGKESWNYSTENYAKGYVDIEIENIILMNMVDNNTMGIDIRNVRKILLQDVEVRGFKNGIRLRGTWYGSQLKRVVIWSPKPISGSSGLWIDNGVNNTSFENVAILNFEKGVKVYATNNSGSISTLGFRNCNFEFNTAAFYISPTNDNAGNINIESCHFEYNTNVMHILNTNTIWNVSLTNSLLFEGGIILDGNSSGSVIKGVVIDRNTFSSNDKSFDINMGKDIPDNIENIILGNNQYHGTYRIQRPEIKMKNTPQFFEYMPLYNGANQIPWGREDTKGLVGEFRHDANNLYFKSVNGWKIVPLNQQYYYGGQKNNISTYASIPAKTIQPNDSVDVTVPVDGLNPDLEYVITLSPSAWLEGGITFHAYKIPDGKVNIRFINHYAQAVTMQSQRWNIICQVIDY